MIKVYFKNTQAMEVKNDFPFDKSKKSYDISKIIFVDLKNVKLKLFDKNTVFFRRTRFFHWKNALNFKGQDVSFVSKKVIHQIN